MCLSTVIDRRIYVSAQTAWALPLAKKSGSSASLSPPPSPSYLYSIDRHLCHTKEGLRSIGSGQNLVARRFYLLMTVALSRRSLPGPRVLEVYRVIETFTIRTLANDDRTLLFILPVSYIYVEYSSTFLRVFKFDSKTLRSCSNKITGLLFGFWFVAGGLVV